jgi:FKBP-type peptidyl-prolyl cis-trans isomerase FkpA
MLPIAAAMIAACTDAPGNREADAVPPVSSEPAPLVRVAPELGVELEQMMHTDGVYVQDSRVGSGPPAEPGRTVVLEYRAWLADGTLYEQRPNDEGFGAAEVVLGEAQPQGLNAGVSGMRVGGTRRIVIPPALGYGLVGRPAGVPAGATLVYEVRLRAVR